MVKKMRKMTGRLVELSGAADAIGRAYCATGHHVKDISIRRRRARA